MNNRQTQREIKFRAWNVRRWLRDNEWAITPTGKLLVYNTRDDTWEDTDKLDIKVCQYTGLKDKNGREIYEGDVVAHPLCVKEPHDENEQCETFVGRINYEADRGQYLAVNMKRNGRVIVMSEAYKFEVIGNIYETPELIKVHF
jgi:uncharacterized phage protein (TIGR01671 family)